VARPRNGTSGHTQYRRSAEHLAELKAQFEKLARSRPRTSGKKAARTRTLNALKRKIAAAQGRLTKARAAIARATSQGASARSTARRKRSEAAKKGWEARRTRKAAPAVTSGLVMPFLTLAGVRDVWPPAKSDRSKVGSCWNAVDAFLSNGSRALLDGFAGDSIYDELSGLRLPFITDPTIIIAHSDEYDFGASLYRDRRNRSAE
jgi:hypothetical protein